MATKRSGDVAYHKEEIKELGIKIKDTSEHSRHTKCSTALGFATFYTTHLHNIIKLFFL